MKTKAATKGSLTSGQRTSRNSKKRIRGGRRGRNQASDNANNNESLVTATLTMLQDESIPSDDESAYQTEFFNDLDLAVLGSSPEDYLTYTESLQKEFASGSYKKDRLKMLKTLLMIPFIYSTEKLREKFEAAARINVQNEIDELEK